MSKFKVGDKVALNNSPNVLLGQIMCELFGGYYIEMEENYYAIMPENRLVAYDEPILSDNEIYNMLRPKMDKTNILKHGHYYRGHAMFNVDEVIKVIALAYRSGYLRAKKGRPFKIGGEKD
jgi:hypothetical protein